MRGRPWSRALALGAVTAAALAVALGLTAEVRTSWLQSELLSRAVRDLTFQVEPGPSDAIRFPINGPYDQRLGYVQLPGFIERLRAQGFEVERQARLSERHRDAIDYGAFPIYREKTAAGLVLLDRSGTSCSAPAFRSAPTPITTRCRGCSRTACCSSRIASCWPRARRDAIRRSSGTVSRWPCATRRSSCSILG
jgi:hypothetical protein